jgi:hypothetical protein
MRLSEVEKAMFHRVACPCEIISCLLAVKKCDFGGVEKGMFQEIAWPYDHIFCLLAGQKCVLAQVEKAFNQWPLGREN